MINYHRTTGFSFIIGRPLNPTVSLGFSNYLFTLTKVIHQALTEEIIHVWLQPTLSQVSTIYTWQLSGKIQLKDKQFFASLRDENINLPQQTKGFKLIRINTRLEFLFRNTINTQLSVNRN